MRDDEELHLAATLDYVLAYSPAVLAILGAQLVASTSSLRYWLAVCAIPSSGTIPNEEPIPAIQPQPAGRQPWWRGVLTKAAVVVFGVALYSTYRAIGREAPEVDATLSVILIPLAIGATTYLFSTYSALPSISVHRNSAGALVNIQSKSTNFKTLTMVYLFLSIAICVGTFIAESDVFTTFTFFASIVVFSRWCMRVTSLRAFAIIFAIIFACDIVLIAPLTDMLLSKSGKGDENSPNSAVKQSLERFMVYAMWINAATCSSLTVSLASFCLRFDYHIHLEHSVNLSLKPFAVDKVLSMPGFGPGAVVPSRIPTGFSKPYFFTSMVTFIFAATTTLACLQFLGITLDHMTANMFILVAAGAIFFLHLLAVISMAGLRGEWQILSQYKEEWICKPIPAKSDINLDEGSGGKLESVPLLEHSSDAN
ncbi:hypothetical protein BD410DRAFT_781677 [Rickenella mellea]|uniref:Uncharacterized protein n=1 Tax=Rickenella mellea TaxID=50990 RepID=A0A4Y7QJF6_9AGAM|nr:hypothetical protein BD410DRAFT_781677 [Rickenella mellea]